MPVINHSSTMRVLLIPMVVTMVLAAVLLLVPASAYAQGLHGQSDAFREGAGFSETQQDPRKITAVLVNGVLSVLGMVMTGYLFWGGYLILTGGGAEERIARGKRSVWTSVVGAAVLLSAFALARFSVYLSSEAADPSNPATAGTDGFTVQPHAVVPDDPLYDSEFGGSAWGSDGTFGSCFGPLCE